MNSLSIHNIGVKKVGVNFHFLVWKVPKRRGWVRGYSIAPEFKTMIEDLYYIINL